MQEGLSPKLRKIQRQIDATVWTEQDFSDVLKLQTTNVLVSEGKGYLLYSDSGQECEVLMIGVIPAERKKGIADGLLKEVIALGKPVFLEVAESNKSAINLYVKNGFEIVGKRKKYYKNGETALTMKR